MTVHPKIPHDLVVGVILAGGQSRRMGGGDKCLRQLAGQAMLAHVISRLQPQCASLVINANGAPERFSEFHLPVTPDTLLGHAGPLAGVLAGMRWAHAHASGAHWVASVSADAPFIPIDLVQRLADHLSQQATDRRAAVALAQSGGRLHPVIGLWPLTLMEDLETALAEGMRKVLAWTDRHGTLAVEFPFEPVGSNEIDPFFNVNTPEDLAEAERIVAIRSPADR